jgi:hypothetical protein
MYSSARDVFLFLAAVIEVTTLMMDILGRAGVGTNIGRKSVSKGKEYARIWVYVPTKVSEDTAFPFRIGAPCLVEINEEVGLGGTSL